MSSNPIPAEPGNDDRAPQRPRRRMVIDWAAVGLTAVDWLVAGANYAFVVLLSGLVGGWLGSFANLGLWFLGDESMRGQRWGWVVGAVVALVGWPRGWVTINNRKGSLPKRRSLFHVASVASRRRKKHDSSGGPKSLLHVVRDGALFGLLGVVAGAALGLGLVMCWISLSMSPFCPAEWGESTRYERLSYTESKRLHDDVQNRVVLTSDHPLPWYLFLTPPLILGTLGAVLGTADAARRYALNLRSTSAEERVARAQEKRRTVLTAEEAAKAAAAEGLPRLASPPRRVPWAVRWRLLRGGVGLALASGPVFVLISVAFGSAFGLGAFDADDPVPILVLVPVFGVVGVAALVGGVTVWRRRIGLLRSGYLARARIVTMLREKRSASLEVGFDELYRMWHKPVPKRFGLHHLRMIGWAMAAFVTLLALWWIAGLIFGFWFAWSEGELWLVLPLTAMALFGAWFFRLVFQFLRRFVSMGDTPSKLHIPPIVRCRLEFDLPPGATQQVEANMNFQSRLDAGSATGEELLVYHPVTPARALLLSSFGGALRIDDDGQWMYETGVPAPAVAEAGDAMVYITPSGTSYHRERCRHAGQSASAVPLRYARRYYEPCESCDPTRGE